MMKRILTILLCLVFGAAISFGQGCSDAGFCTMGAMKPDQAYSKKVNFKLRSIEVSQYRGTTTLSPIVYVANLDVALGITDRTGFQVKLPYQWTTGNFGESSGLGDISLSVTHNFRNIGSYELNATMGMKIPSNKSDLTSDGTKVPGSEGLVFPMYQQVSLGSWDIVAGASLINNKWMFAVGYQNALTANNNTFKWSDWDPIYQDGNGVDYVHRYDIATKLKRGSDVMIRVERNFRFARYNFNIGLLPIYRVTKDQIIDKNTGEYTKLEGTTGLAASVLVGGGYNFNINNTIKFTYGQKLTDRDVNPDGLTRHNVIIVAYLFRF
jgi:hypothetical protein